MLLALEGIAGAGKSTLRDRVLSEAMDEGLHLGHVGQFSWLFLQATRVIVELRSGAPAADPAQALAAVRGDLELHTRHNLIPALHRGPVIADRWVLSTACLLALLDRRPVAEYVEHLVRESTVLPETTVLLTTPPSVCAARLAGRGGGRRFAEEPTIAQRLAVLHRQAVSAWWRFTGRPVLLHPCNTEHDLRVLTAACLDRLHKPAQATTRTWESNDAPTPTAPSRLGS